MQNNKDLYQLLGLPTEASEDDIQRAHRKLVREYHPDANPEDPRAEERFKEIQQAYEVLSDDKRRREYDKRLYTSSTEASGRPDTRAAGAKTGGGAAHGMGEPGWRADVYAGLLLRNRAGRSDHSPTDPAHTRS